MKVDAGSTNVSLYVYFVDDVSGTATGEPTTGLLFSDIETGGSASYMRQGAARTDFTLQTLASAAAAHADGGFILVDDTNMPGLYRVDVPDAAFASGADFVIIQLVAAAANNTLMRPLLVMLQDYAQLVDDILDEVNTAAAHNVANSVGKQLRALSNRVAYEGTVNDAGASTTVFIIDSGASSVDNFYADQPIVFTDGALNGQTRTILSYTGSTRTVTLDEALTSAPANGVGFTIFADHIHAIADITADIDANSTQLAAILTDTGTTIPALLPAALVGGKMDANVGSIAGVAASATNLEKSTDTILSGTASGTPTTTTMVSDISVTVDDQFKGRTIIFASDTSTAALQNQATDITACTASSNTLTFTALTTAPSSGDTFIVV